MIEDEKIVELFFNRSEKAIRELEEEEVLILIDALDERSTVKATAKSRAQALMPAEVAEEIQGETETEEGQEGDA